MSHLFRLFRTVRHLRPKQVLYQLFYRWGRGLQSSNEKESRNYLSNGGEVIPPPVPESTGTGQPSEFSTPWDRVTVSPEGVCFELLNRERSFPDVTEVDWNCDDHGKLWTYHLNYFHFLRGGPLSDRDAQALIDSWIASSSAPGDGWEPYPLSLRLVNWLQYYRERRLSIPDRVRRSLHAQYRSLWRKLEYHLMANHLLENAIALRLAAAYFRDLPGVRRADRLLNRQLREQFLNDGGHYERSPAYHAILTGRLLELYDWLVADVPAGTASALGNRYFEVTTNQKITTLDTVGTVLSKALGWLDQMGGLDRELPAFNDSPRSFAPDVTDLLVRAKHLGIPVRRIPLSDSGFRYRKCGKAEFWFNGAPVAPAHQPGHAHAGHLDWVCRLDGRPLVVNTGVSTYEKNGVRARERSTAAHNTVAVGETDASEVWGGFRVGRRAAVGWEREAAGELGGVHDGYRRIGVTHYRLFEPGNRKCCITDVLSGRSHPAVARIHFHPDQRPRLGAHQLELAKGKISWSGAHTVRLTPYEYAAGFNDLRPAHCLELHFTDRLVTELTY